MTNNVINVWTISHISCGRGPTLLRAGEVFDFLLDDDELPIVPKHDMALVEEELKAMPLNSIYKCQDWRVEHHTITQEEYDNMKEWDGF